MGAEARACASDAPMHVSQTRICRDPLRQASDKAPPHPPAAARSVPSLNPSLAPRKPLSGVQLNAATRGTHAPFGSNVLHLGLQPAALTRQPFRARVRSQRRGVSSSSSRNRRRLLSQSPSHLVCGPIASLGRSSLLDPSITHSCYCVGWRDTAPAGPGNTPFPGPDRVSRRPISGLRFRGHFLCPCSADRARTYGSCN